MTTLRPRGPYTSKEIEELYPEGLQLQLVQILLRHGERSPVSTRFRNAGLPSYWPYCNAAKQLSSIAMTGSDPSQWDKLQWRRRMETFGQDDSPMIAAGPRGEVDGVCQHGELTDKGRETTFALGQRLRRLYVDQLGFMPRLISNADSIYLRATPLSRALESVQQSFWGMYPPTARTASFPPPTIVTRTAADETLFPNESNCRRFADLSRAFAQRTADRWNSSQEMAYLNNLLSKWMPPDSPRVAVDSHPRLSGIMDTVNSTLAHGPVTRLPSEFYDGKGRRLIEKIGLEEWFSGYSESREYRAVGIGGLVGDVVSRMVGSVEGDDSDGIREIGETGEGGIRSGAGAGSGGDGNAHGRGGESCIKFAMSGCHDTTLAAVLASFGCFPDEQWPPFTSHVAIELFRRADALQGRDADPSPPANPPPSDGSRGTLGPRSGKKGLGWSSLFGSGGKVNEETGGSKFPERPTGIRRRQLEELTTEERSSLDGYFVRMRYNDRPVIVPGCRLPGSHLEGDESFCTLEAFKRIADKFTPKNWKQACEANLDGEAFPKKTEEAGY